VAGASRSRTREASRSPWKARSIGGQDETQEDASKTPALVLRKENRLTYTTDVNSL